MTAVEMRLSLLQELAAMPDDEKVLKKILTYLRRMKQAIEADREPTHEEILARIRKGQLEIEVAREGGYQLRDAGEFLPYTMEELNARIDRAEEDIATGRVISNEQMFQEIDGYMDKLCK